MIIISSGAYVISEFQAELGKIPPCFLPLGNKKLLEHQVSQLQAAFPNEQIIVSLPESYVLSQAEKNLITQLNILNIAVPDDFSLAESISYIINITNYLPANEAVRIMYGDTLIHDLPNQTLHENILGVAVSEDGYDWKIEEYKEQQPIIWCGFYSFVSKADLIRCLALKRHSFIDAIQLYRTEHPCKTHHFKQWFDLGHVNTYFRSRALITTQRAFNELRIENGVVHKTGTPKVKIEAEGLWFQNIPSNLKIFTPQLIYCSNDEQTARYALEYLPNMPLNELFVHGKNTSTEWLRLFRLIGQFFQQAKVELSLEDKQAIEQDFKLLIEEKTYKRLKQYAAVAQIDVEKPCQYANKTLPSLLEICEQCIHKTKALPHVFGVLHGDLCFSNILYDSRAFQIKVIDPRGLNTLEQFTILGDQKYDLAKLTHSIVGLYDHIIAGRYSLTDDEIHFDIDQRILQIQKDFLNIDLVDGISVKDILPLVVLLFLSMLPLHSDRPDRQKAMLMNALRIYQQI